MITSAVESVLLGDGAASVVSGVVSVEGGRLCEVAPARVHHRPGRSVAVVYDARVAWPGDDRVGTELVVAMASADGPPEGARVVVVDGVSVGVWRVRDDPMLPGLRAVLAEEGDVSLVSYRPTRRAVVRVRGVDGERFAKVVRPAEAAALVDAHRRFSAAGLPTPAVLSSDEGAGVVRLAALPGRRMVEAMAAGAPLPSPAGLVDLLRRIAAEVSPPPGHRVRRSARVDAPAHARLLATVLPDVADRIRDTVGRLGADPPDEARGMVHGDFYEAQLLVGEDGRMTGLLDLDRAGTGSVADDLATMLAHLGALAIHRPALATRALAYRDDLWRYVLGESLVPPDDLGQRVAAVGLGLATGPYRLRRPGWRAETVRYLDEVVDAKRGPAAAGPLCVVGTGVDPVTSRFSGARSTN